MNDMISECFKEGNKNMGDIHQFEIKDKTGAPFCTLPFYNKTISY